VIDECSGFWSQFYQWMRKMYLDIYLEKTLLWRSFNYHIQSAHDDQLQAAASEFAKQEVQYSGMS